MNNVQGFELGRERGCPFFLVFAYTVNGPVLYKGDLGSIRNFTATAPTHHGFAMAYRHGMPVNSPSGKHAILLGRNTFQYPSYNPTRNRDQKQPCYLELRFIDGRSGYSYIDKHYNGRRTFGLFLRQLAREDTTLLFRWRKLPKTYLRQLAEADRILDAAQEESNV